MLGSGCGQCSPVRLLTFVLFRISELKKKPFLGNGMFTKKMSTTNIFPTTITEETTTEFWTSENDFDASDIIVKRVLYTIHLWCYRVICILALMNIFNFVVCVPVCVVVVVMMCKIRNVIRRKREYLENDSALKALVKKRADKEIEKLKRKEMKLKKEALAGAFELGEEIKQGMNPDPPKKKLKENKRKK